jgi:hypothetical protein
MPYAPRKLTSSKKKIARPNPGESASFIISNRKNPPNVSTTNKIPRQCPTKSVMEVG